MLGLIILTTSFPQTQKRSKQTLEPKNLNSSLDKLSRDSEIALTIESSPSIPQYLSKINKFTNNPEQDHAKTTATVISKKDLKTLKSLEDYRTFLLDGQHEKNNRVRSLLRNRCFLHKLLPNLPSVKIQAENRSY